MSEKYPKLLKLPYLPAELVALNTQDDADMFNWCRLNGGACSNTELWRERIRMRYGSRAVKLVLRTYGSSYDRWYISEESRMLSSLYEGRIGLGSLRLDNVDGFFKKGWLVLIDYLRDHLNELQPFFRETRLHDTSNFSADYIFKAASAGQGELVKMLIEDYGLNPNDSKWSPVGGAAKAKRFDLIEYLLPLCTFAHSWFVYSAMSGSIEVFEYFLQRYPDLEDIQGMGSDTFAWACETGGVRMIEYLIKRGYTPQTYDSFLIAFNVAKSNDPEVYRYLLNIVGFELDQEVVMHYATPEMKAALN